MKILVTGGAGYIGSHVVAQLHQDGHQAVIVDDFSNSEEAYLANINDAVGQDVPFFEGDFADTALLNKIIDEHGPIDGVIHFAAFKYVNESVEEPLKYYRNNVSGFVELLEVLVEKDIPIIFSSSAAVYGEPASDTVTEDEILKPMNSYGFSKLMDEQILEAACGAKKPARGIALRYFNVVGADESGKIGETLTEFSQNLLPVVVKAAASGDPMKVFGDDFPTPDGTGQRDYVHVVDLADAHVKAMEYLVDQEKGYYNVYNVGTGVPTSVLDLINSFEKVTGQKVPYEIVGRRAGDPAAYFAICDRIKNELGWQSKYTVEDALRHAWNFQQTQKS